MKNWKYEVYQVPFSVMESLSDEGKPTPFLYWGKDKSDSVYEFSKETARICSLVMAIVSWHALM